MTATDFIDSYEYDLEHDFDHDGQPAANVPGFPKEWGSESSKLDLGKAPNCMALSDDDTLLVVNIDHDIGVFDIVDGGEFILKYLLKGHQGHVSAVAFQPSSRTILVSGSSLYGSERETHVRLWDLSEHATVDDQYHSHARLTEAARFASDAAKNYLVRQDGWRETDFVASYISV